MAEPQRRVFKREILGGIAIPLDEHSFMEDFILSQGCEDCPIRAIYEKWARESKDANPFWKKECLCDSYLRNREYALSD
jgi:hypothetical protein